MNKPFFSKKSICLFGVLFIMTGFAFEAAAHGVHLSAKPVGNEINIVAGYSGGEKIRYGRILATEDKSGEKVFTGVTDNAGRLSFKIPEKVIEDKAGVRIILNAGMGHRSECNISYTEINNSLYRFKMGLEDSTLRSEKIGIVKEFKIKPLRVSFGILLVFIIFGAVYLIRKSELAEK